MLLNAMTCDDETRKKIIYLVTHDVVHLTTYNEETEKYDSENSYPVIYCSDCSLYKINNSDTKNLTKEEITELYSLVKKFGYWSSVVWEEYRLGASPREYSDNDYQKRHQEKYLQAKKETIPFLEGRDNCTHRRMVSGHWGKDRSFQNSDEEWETERDWIPDHAEDTVKPYDAYSVQCTQCEKILTDRRYKND